MSEVDEVIEAVKAKKGLLHLGENAGDADVYIGLRVLFDAAREAIASEMRELERLNTLSRVGTIGGIVLIFAGLVMYVGFNLDAGKVTGGVGVLTEIVPLFLFRRVDESRKALRHLIPDYKLMFAALIIAESKGGSGRARLVDALSKDALDSAFPKARQTHEGIDEAVHAQADLGMGR